MMKVTKRRQGRKRGWKEKKDREKRIRRMGGRTNDRGEVQ